MTTTAKLPKLDLSPTETDLSQLRLGDNAAARSLLDEWMADESGYDERVWPQVKQLIEENRLSDRKQFIN